jgi:arsenical pump membrane protein
VIVPATLALVASLAAAVVRHRWAPEALVAIAGAAVLLAVGAIGLDGAWEEAKALAPTLAFLAALLVLGEGCDRAGLFSAAAGAMATGARGSAERLLAVAVGAAALVTAVLGLDATVVLLTPAVLVAARRVRVPSRPGAYACGHLANSGSLLLPVSNLTNLLAFHAVALSFAHFGALMALPWLVAVTLEWLALRRFFGADLRVRPPAPGGTQGVRPLEAGGLKGSDPLSRGDSRGLTPCAGGAEGSDRGAGGAAVGLQHLADQGDRRL